MKMYVLSLCGALLVAICSLAAPPPGSAEPAPPRVPAFNLLIGKVLEWCVAADMTPEQIETIFGYPDASMSETHGPPLDSHTSVTWSYMKYGVTVNFYDPPPHKGTGVRVIGEVGP